MIILKPDIWFLEYMNSFILFVFVNGIAETPEYTEILKYLIGDVETIYDCLKHYYENQLVVGKIEELNAHRNDFELIDKTTSIKAGNCYLSLVNI